MVLDLRIALGVGGVAPDDRPEARRWEKRLHWLMIVVATLSLPAIYLEEASVGGRSYPVGRLLEAGILLAFVAELGWMLRLTAHRAEYLARNWLDVVIIACAAASLAGLEMHWVILGRLARLTLVGLLIARAMMSLGELFVPGKVHLLLVISAGSMLIAGAGFYWLEPTVQTFWEGLWLAFVTGSTVGYGDVVPTSVGAKVFAVLSVVVGFTLLSLMTAAVVSRFVGAEEQSMHEEMHRDIRHLRDNITELVSDEEKAIRRELRTDMRHIAEEIEALRKEVARLAKKIDGA